MSAPRFIPAARACRRSCPRRESASRAAAARRRGAHLRDPQAGGRRLHPRGLCRGGHHDGSARRRCLREAVAERRNILVAGGTSTGKTTLANALLAEVAKTSDRVVLIEDTRELQCRARQPRWRCARRMAWPRCPTWCARRCGCGPTAFRSAKCAAPKRSISSRPGAPVIPAASAPSTPARRIGALRRLEQLIQEAVVTVPRALIAETIDLIAVLSGRGVARRLTELARVDGLGADSDYALSPAGERQ